MSGINRPTQVQACAIHPNKSIEVAGYPSQVAVCGPQSQIWHLDTLTSYLWKDETRKTSILSASYQSATPKYVLQGIGYSYQHGQQAKVMVQISVQYANVSGTS